VFDPPGALFGRGGGHRFFSHFRHGHL